MEQDDQLLAQEIRAHYFPGETGAIFSQHILSFFCLLEIRALYFSDKSKFIFR